MTLPLPSTIQTRREAHFRDRVVRCFVDRARSVWQLFADAAAKAPQAEALVFEDRRWTYHDLALEAERVAAGLAACGVHPGDRVALYVGNRPEFMFALLGTLRLGAISVPMGTRLQGPEVAYILEHCGAVAVVHDAELTDRLPSPRDNPRLAHRFVNAPRAENPPAIVPVNEEDTAVILYTSGTTGRPKGAMLTHLNIAHSTLHFQYCAHLRDGDRAGLAVPASHVTGLVAIIATMWQVCGATLMMSEFKADAFLALAARERLSYTVMVPAMYNLCLMRSDFGSFDLSAWRVGGYGGAPMPEATIASLASRLPGLGLVNAYGATETTSPTTLLPADAASLRPDSVGLALPCAEVIVVDAYGHELPPGESGELWIRGPMVVPGYWDDPKATHASFTAGFWHSGDVGSVDAEGYVRVFDRIKDMLNRGGFKIYSVEVENVLSAHPGVIESAIVGRPCPVLGERVHAFVSVSDAAVTADELQAYCAARLADYKVPESYTITTQPLPRNANGKLLKRQLREQVTAASA